MVNRAVMNNEVLQAYKAMIKALVRTERISRIAQRKGENKKEIAMLTYKRINIVREQSKKDLDVLRKTRLMKDFQILNKRVDMLKNENIEGDKRLLFLEDSSTVKELFLCGDVNDRALQHARDISSFITNQREYDELIERYNPTSSLSQEEIITRTAGKVGLDIPK